jgi:hypothetical protein
MALFSSLIGAGMLVMVLTGIHRLTLVMVLWLVAIVGVLAFNLWAAFSPRGGGYAMRRDHRGHR